MTKATARKISFTVLLVVGGAALALPAFASGARATSLVSGPASGTGGSTEHASMTGSSSDGRRVFFTTAESLIAADTDGLPDVYERSGAALSLVSDAGAGASDSPESAFFVGASNDGGRIFFATNESLVAADTDGLLDVYERTAGTTELISPPSAGQTGFVGASDDGERVFFLTADSLAPNDPDSDRDIYEFERSSGAARLVSAPGAGASGPSQHVVTVSTDAVSSDGNHVFFISLENLVGSDTDGLNDVYEHSGGSTTLVSAPGTGGTDGRQHALWEGASDDGTHVYFKTFENFVGEDTDGQFDIYERSDGATRLVSAPTPAGSYGAPEHASFAGASKDGAHVFFTTTENLAVGQDAPGQDVYERFGGTTQLVSAPGAGSGLYVGEAAFGGTSSDGTRVFFTTTRRLVGADTDFAQDVYERSGGTTTLVSAPGPGATGDAQPASFGGTSSDGTRVFFTTEETLTGADPDGFRDVYERSDGATTLVSTPGAGATGSGHPAFFQRASSDGTRVLFWTVERLVGEDRDSAEDVYVNRPNLPPVLESIGDQAVDEGGQLAFTIEGSDPDGDALAYIASNLPAGATFDPPTRTFTWTPGFDQAGSSNARFEVTDGTETVSREITIVVRNVNRAPVLAGIGDRTVNEGEPLQFTISATDPDGDALTYAASNLPAGATFDPPTRTFTWTPGFDRAGGYADVRLEVTDGAETDSKQIAITVIDVDSGGGGEPVPGDGSDTTEPSPDADAGDTTAPQTTIDSGPMRVKESRARIRFSSSEAGSSFECRLDKGPFKPCASPKRLKHLTKGTHRFFVRAIDAAGNADPSAAKLRFEID